MNRYFLRITTGVAVVTLLAGCATNAGAKQKPPQTAQQKIVKCAAMVAGGALLGNLLGKDKEATLLGAAVGGAACGTWLAFNNQADKRRLAEAQARALQSGQAQQESWRGEDGKSRSLDVQLGDETTARTAGGTGLICRAVNTTVSANGGSADNSEEWCRTPDGSYRPRSELTA